MNLLDKCVIAFVVCLTLSVPSCVAHSDYRASKMVEAGADPIAAMCAISTLNTQVCSEYVLTREEGVVKYE